MRTKFLLLILIAVLVGCASRTSTSVEKSSKLPDIQTTPYKVDPYIHAAIELQSLGHSNALVRLHLMARDRKFKGSAIILCRMLFTRRPGSDFRRPGIGFPGFLNGTDYADWPLEPIELVDGIPFMIARGYIVSGLAESDEEYLRYCETNCDWSAFRYTVKSQPQKQEALNKLFASPKWKTSALKAFDRQFFSEQIE